MKSTSLRVKRALAEFIKIYHENEPLWNTEHKDYTKVCVRSACYDALVDKMRETQPYATRDDVLRKINTIRSSFRKEYRKVMYTEKVGLSYTPKLWYYKDLTFLIDIKRSGQEETTEHIIPDNSHQETVPEQEIEMEQPEPSETYNMTQEEDHISYTRSAMRIESETVERKTLRRRKETHAMIFGRHVAAKLEIVSQYQRIFLEKLINDAIFEAELGNLSRDCRIILE